MVTARLLTRSEAATAPRHQEGALDLARRLPSLVASAKELAASVMHGVHGRRRAGTGENFWQFRPFTYGEPAQRIDWRRSARDDRLYVREREWEAAHTIFLWMDLSPSMAFMSSLARQSKADRVEETFPSEGHTEFLDVDSGTLFRAGRAEAYRADYVARLALHRDRVRFAAREAGFSFALQRTDAPPATALLALRGRLEANVEIGAV